MSSTTSCRSRPSKRGKPLSTNNRRVVCLAVEEYERCLRIWKNWSRSAPEEITLRLGHYQFNQAYHSVRLEYTDLPFNVANQLWETSKVAGFTGSIYSAIALNNHKIASTLAEECLRDGEPLSVELICGLQHALSCGLYDTQAYVYHEDRPGEYKNADQVDGLIDVGADPDEIEETIENLVQEMPHIADMNDTLVAGAYLHSRLLFLRPFAIANGPVSRLVMNYWLRTQGHPPIVIPCVEAARYKQCLEQFDVQEDIEPLALFLCDQVIGFWKDQMTAKEERPNNPAFKLRF